MEQEGGWESAFMCDAMLRACAVLGEVQLSLLTVKSMHALGIPVGYVAHGSVLTVLSRAGRVQVGCRLGCWHHHPHAARIIEYHLQFLMASIMAALQIARCIILWAATLPDCERSFSSHLFTGL